MVIETPTFVQDIKPKARREKQHEGVKLFFAFMYRLAVNGHARGFDNMRYYINSNDMRYFMRGYILTPQPYFEDFDKSYFQMGIVADDMWFFTWKKRPEISQYDFKDAELCAVWGYILGKEFAGPLYEEGDGKIPNPTKQKIVRQDDRKFFSFAHPTIKSPDSYKKKKKE